MSDARVMATLDDLESLLASMTDDPDPRAIAAWQISFKEALAGAERGPQWPVIVSRAQNLAKCLDLKVNRLTAIRGLIKQELLNRAKGTRALSAYAPRPH